jgi:metallophosphoesterase (TIGR00282 family)
LPALKDELKPDLIIANVENLAHGKGVTKSTLAELTALGIEAFTSGNHIWDKPEVFEIMKNETVPLFRPANYPPGVEGKGAGIITTASGKRVLVINLMGRVFFKESVDCPFRKADEVLDQYKNDNNINAIFVDFHAEATSEKVAMGHYLDGRVSAVVGTHIQVPTADWQVLKGGTAFITDAGYVGAKDSIIGVVKEGPLKQFLSQKPGGGFDIPETGVCSVNGVIVELDEHTKMARSIDRVYKEVEI